MMLAVKARRRSLHLLLGTFLVYALLVATHEGEFWPFSIYPMFSQGGNEWSRVVVRELPEDSVEVGWVTFIEDALPGSGFPLARHGIDAIDLANFVSKTERWTDPRIGGLHHMFHDQLDERQLLVLQVRGRLTETDSIRVDYEPVALLRADTTLLSPSLPR